MKLIINGKKEEIKNSKISLEKLFELKDVENPEMVSVQINGKIVRRENYSKTDLLDNNEIDFLYFIGGGSRIYLKESIYF